MEHARVRDCSVAHPHVCVRDGGGGVGWTLKLIRGEAQLGGRQTRKSALINGLAMGSVNSKALSRPREECGTRRKSMETVVEMKEQPMLRCVPSESLGGDALETAVELLEQAAAVSAESIVCQVVMGEGDRWPSALVQFKVEADTQKFMGGSGTLLDVMDEDRQGVNVRKPIRLSVVAVGSEEEARLLGPRTAAGCGAREPRGHPATSAIPPYPTGVGRYACDGRRAAATEPGRLGGAGGGRPRCGDREYGGARRTPGVCDAAAAPPRQQ